MNGKNTALSTEKFYYKASLDVVKFPQLQWMAVWSVDRRSKAKLYSVTQLWVVGVRWSVHFD